MKVKLQHAGFAHMVIIAAVVVVAVLGGSGYAVYHAHHKAKATNTEAAPISKAPPKKSTPSTTDKTTPATATYFTISEWGVQAPYSGSDLSYTAGSDASTVLLSSKQLADVSATCKAGDAGYIGRYAPTDTFPGPSQQTAQAYFSQNFPADGKPDFAKVGNYYYMYTASQDDCASDATAFSQATAAARQIVDNLRMIQ